MVQYLHFRILRFPLKLCVNMWAGIFLTLAMAMGLGRKGRYIRYLVAHIEIGGIWIFIPRKFWLMPASIWLWTIPRPSPLKKTPYCFCSFFKNLMHFFFKTTHRPMFLAEFLDEAQLHPARCSPAPVPVSPSNRWPKSPATWPGPVTAFHGGICGKLDPPKGWVAMILCDMLCELKLKWFSMYFRCIFHVFAIFTNASWGKMDDSEQALTMMVLSFSRKVAELTLAGRKVGSTKNYRISCLDVGNMEGKKHAHNYKIAQHIHLHIYDIILYQ